LKSRSLLRSDFGFSASPYIAGQLYISKPLTNDEGDLRCSREIEASVYPLKQVLHVEYVIGFE